MRIVKPQQLWSLLIPLRGRLAVRSEHRVDEIHGAVVVLTALATGKVHTVALSMLGACRRGSRLVRNADGSAADPYKPRPYREA